LDIIILIAGVMITVAGIRGLFNWMQWRSTPKEILQKRVSDTIFKTTITAYGKLPSDLSLVSGHPRWSSLEKEWPAVTRFSMPLPSMEIASLIAPPELGEGSGVFARNVMQDTPEPPESESLQDNERGLNVGTAVATGNVLKLIPMGTL